MIKKIKVKDHPDPQDLEIEKIKTKKDPDLEEGEGEEEAGMIGEEENKEKKMVLKKK